MKLSKLLPLVPVIFGAYVAGTIGFPIFMAATTLTELLKGLILTGVSIFIAFVGFILFIGWLMND